MGPCRCIGACPSKLRRLTSVLRMVCVHTVAHETKLWYVNNGQSPNGLSTQNRTCITNFKAE